MNQRVDIKSVLRDPVKRRELMVATLIATQAREGVTTTREQAEAAYDKVQEERQRMLISQRFRVTIVCACKADYVVGYGATAAEAHATAGKIYRRNHGRRKPFDTVLDEVTPDGTHYEEVTP